MPAKRNRNAAEKVLEVTSTLYVVLSEITLASGSRLIDDEIISENSARKFSIGDEKTVENGAFAWISTVSTDLPAIPPGPLANERLIPEPPLQPILRRK
ncbi:hypothetical protein LF1_13290 [Rubripirellula obstinata]|uniref:Uncharacterized protein n=1 Tax=Rubripirellula obstinata TaxID=406547 RepID=A0A5B1CFV8_9BACT|nr:hypothetical protein LF1_13290 [Rubripirellula obstinata]